MSTLWWLTVLALTGTFLFAAGWVCHSEWLLWRRARDRYVREITLTHQSRSVR